MGQTTLRGQIWRALDAIDKQGESKHLAKQEQGWKRGQPVYGVFSGGTQNTVFDRAMTFANWLTDNHLEIRLFRDLDEEIVIEFMAEKTATCQPNTIQALLAALRKLQEGLLAMRWIREPIVPAEWAVDGHNVRRGLTRLKMRRRLSNGWESASRNTHKLCVLFWPVGRELMKYSTCGRIWCF